MMPSVHAAPSILHLAGQSLLLLPERAVWWPAQQMLLVADLHVGKSTAFRSLGVAVPRGTTSQTLAQLDTLVERHGARQLAVLGDFLHAAHGRGAATLGALARWRERHPALELLLVRGNHDHHAGDPPLWLRARIVDEPHAIDGFGLCHHPRPQPGLVVIAGHLHPCVRLSGRAHDRLRLPCFHLSGGVLVLPAFGAFTGMHPIERQPGDRVFVVGDERVVEWPGAPQPAAAGATG